MPSGDHSLRAHRHVRCGGNLLANGWTPQVMVDVFLGSNGTLRDRLIATLQAAQFRARRMVPRQARPSQGDVAQPHAADPE
jgi:uncharacterized Ntn-hydrolase superfamily protein